MRGKPPVTANSCLMCGKTNLRLRGPSPLAENMRKTVRKPFHFWRTWAIAVTGEQLNEYMLSRR